MPGWMRPKQRRSGSDSEHSQLNTRYVTQGVIRFVNGQYATGQAWGFMLGYVLALPADAVIQAVDQRLRQDYGEAAKLKSSSSHVGALSIHEGELQRNSGTPIRLRHILVDMVLAAPRSS